MGLRALEVTGINIIIIRGQQTSSKSSIVATDSVHRRQLDFLPAIASTSGRIHFELLGLLFLHAHRETSRFLEIFDDGHAQPHTFRFTHRRAAYLTLSRARQVSW